MLSFRRSLMLASLLTLTAPAGAADLLTAEQPVVAAPTYIWSGAYAGGFVGYNFAKFDHSAGPDFDGEGFVGGVYAGYNLQTNQLDLMLIHWPSPNNAVPLAVYIEQLAEAHALGLTRLIGVSNFTIAMLEQAQAILGELKIANNQVELNPLLQNRKLASYCAGKGISVTCYLPIARGVLGDVPVIAEIAARHGATPEQVALAFEFAKGYIAIPTSSRPDRIRANYLATKLVLSDADIALIETVDRGQRVIDPAWGPAWD